MKTQSLICSLAAVFAVAACGQSANGQSAEDGFAAISGTYTTDPGHRYITFSYMHQGLSRPFLRWRDWEGTLEWNAEEPASSSVNVVIDTASIDTGVDVFDGHLQEERFFDAANHPEITFVSTGVEKTGDNTGVITGDLTIKGQTKPVSLNVTYNTSRFDDRNQV